MFPALVAVLAHEVCESDGCPRGQNARLFRLDQCKGGTTCELLVLVQPRCDVLNIERTSTHIPGVVDANIMAFDFSRIEIRVLVIDASRLACVADSSQRVKRRLFRSRIPRVITNDEWITYARSACGRAIAGSSVEQVQQIERRVIFFTEQADRPFLFDCPVVEGEREVVCDIPDDTDGRIL